MKIIERGELKPIKVKCLACNSRLEYDRTDVQVFIEPGYSYNFITCPVCEKEIRVLTDPIPAIQTEDLGW